MALARVPREPGGRAARARAPLVELGAPAVEVEDLHHRYGERVALDGLGFRVEQGELFALLGPNGGGKSTLFAILSTLFPPTGGRAAVLGHDVMREAAAVRRLLGVVFQRPSVDALLTVAENLVHHGHLYGISGRPLHAAIDRLADRLGLADRRAERVGRPSGGLQRRVELAKALLVGARLLLLDEPSTGLDPVARRELILHLRELRDAEGMTVVLTTHDMDEAERCDRVGIVDHGRLVALGTPAALEAEVGGDVLVVRASGVEALRDGVCARFGLEGRIVDGALRLERARGHELVRDLIEAFPGAVESVTYGRPTLEDVFVRRTGHALADSA